MRKNYFQTIITYTSPDNKAGLASAFILQFLKLERCTKYMEEQTAKNNQSKRNIFS